MKALVAAILFMVASTAVGGTKVTLDENGVLVIDGHPTFVLSVGMPPLPGAKTPEGRNGLEQLKDDGLTLLRIRPTTGPQKFAEADIRSIAQWLDAAAAAHLYCCVTLGKNPSILPDAPEHERLLRLAIELYKDHPAMAVWKGYDEPAWVKMPAGPLIQAYKIFKELDPDHSVYIVQAPMKKSLPLEAYNAAGDIMGADIYPVTYPPGTHSDFGNREISVVADCARWMANASQGKSFWMILQIAWQGTVAPGKTLRFPTFPQARYMAYAAIINGARGIGYQGGERPPSLNEQDAKLGWNWTYWEKVMRRLVAELRESSPLHPALVAPDSKLPVKLEGATDIELCVRETPDDLYILAASRNSADTQKVTFKGLPLGEAAGQVLYEEPRKVSVKDGAFEDWFAPYDVHIYRFHKSAGAP